jgi:hypothetical protein
VLPVRCDRALALGRGQALGADDAAGIEVPARGGTVKFLEWWLGDRRDPYTWLLLLQVIVIIALPAGPEWLLALLLFAGTIVVRWRCPWEGGKT